MTPEGIRVRRHDISLWVAEACGVIQRHASALGEQAAREAYGLDEWEYQGAQDGSMRPDTALDVLDKANRMDAASRGC